MRPGVALTIRFDMCFVLSGRSRTGFSRKNGAITGLAMDGKEIRRRIHELEARLVELEKENELAESKALLNSIIESTSDMIWSVDPVSFGLRSFNSSFSDSLLAQCNIRVEPGMSIEDMSPSCEHGKRWLNFYRRALREGPFTIEYEVHAGSHVLELSFNPLKHNDTIFGLSVFGKDITERKKSEETLKRYAQRLIVLDEDLRRGLAAELHDDIAQVLTALGLNLANISNTLSDEAASELRPLLADSRRLTREINCAVRNLMTELRPMLLDEYGLSAVLHWHVVQYARRTGIAVTLHIPPEFPRLAVKKESTLFRVTLEALSNVMKHAAATDVTVSLCNHGDTVRLCISDNGKGFVPSTTVPLPTGSGWGLTIMRERIELIGGTFSIHSALGEGTTIGAEIQRSGLDVDQGTHC